VIEVDARNKCVFFIGQFLFPFSSTQEKRPPAETPKRNTLRSHVFLPHVGVIEISDTVVLSKQTNSFPFPTEYPWAYANTPFVSLTVAQNDPGATDKRFEFVRATLNFAI